jgi:hypothetical protein
MGISQSNHSKKERGAVRALPQRTPSRTPHSTHTGSPHTYGTGRLAGTGTVCTPIHARTSTVRTGRLQAFTVVS